MENGKFLWDIFYPPRCAICDCILGRNETYVCTGCASLPKRILKDFCLKCGRPVGEEQAVCPQCKGRSFSFDAGRSAFIYDRYMRRSIKNFKYHGRQEYALYYADVLFEMYREDVEKTGADAILPVPVHRERFRKRGYNQAELLAEEFGRKMELPVYGNLLVRTKKTAPQKELSDKERLKNLCQAFSVNMKVWELSKGINCVIIIDDIYTTGSTIEACSRALRAFGIKKIFFLCVCTGQGD
ncbi:MAG: ComF family protein [Lachnospiraceae bacterium]|nr:ComF family protein [Lachnospiraceae bacterium]